MFSTAVNAYTLSGLNILQHGCLPMLYRMEQMLTSASTGLLVLIAFPIVLMFVFDLLGYLWLRAFKSAAYSTTYST